MLVLMLLLLLLIPNQIKADQIKSNQINQTHALICLKVKSGEVSKQIKVFA
jgi:hypothetical protein